MPSTQKVTTYTLKVPFPAQIWCKYCESYYPSQQEFKISSGASFSDAESQVPKYVKKIMEGRFVFAKVGCPRCRQVPDWIEKGQLFSSIVKASKVLFVIAISAVCLFLLPGLMRGMGVSANLAGPLILVFWSLLVGIPLAAFGDATWRFNYLKHLLKDPQERQPLLSEATPISPSPTPSWSAAPVAAPAASSATAVNGSITTNCATCGKEIRSLSGGLLVGGGEVIQSMIETLGYICPACGMKTCFRCSADFATQKVICKKCGGQMRPLSRGDSVSGAVPETDYSQSPGRVFLGQMKAHLDKVSDGMRAEGAFGTLALVDSLRQARHMDYVAWAFDKELVKTIQTNGHSHQGKLFGDTYIAVSTLPQGNPFLARNHFSGGYIAFLDSLIRESGYFGGAVNLVHWILCHDSSMQGIHLTLMPKSSQANAAGTRFIIAQDFLSEAERAQMHIR